TLCYVAVRSRELQPSFPTRRSSDLAEILFMILRAENLIKKYKQRTVVYDVSFHVEQGEIVGLLGPNGAGKTTSFYMIVGLIKPRSAEHTSELQSREKLVCRLLREQK